MCGSYCGGTKVSRANRNDRVSHAAGLGVRSYIVFCSSQPGDYHPGKITPISVDACAGNAESDFIQLPSLSSITLVFHFDWFANSPTVLLHVEFGFRSVHVLSLRMAIDPARQGRIPYASYRRSSPRHLHSNRLISSGQPQLQIEPNHYVDDGHPSLAFRLYHRDIPKCHHPARQRLHSDRS